MPIITPKFKNEFIESLSKVTASIAKDEKHHQYLVLTKDHAESVNKKSGSASFKKIIEVAKELENSAQLDTRDKIQLKQSLQILAKRVSSKNVPWYLAITLIGIPIYYLVRKALLKDAAILYSKLTPKDYRGGETLEENLAREELKNAPLGDYRIVKVGDTNWVFQNQGEGRIIKDPEFRLKYLTSWAPYQAGDKELNRALKDLNYQAEIKWDAQGVPTKLILFLKNSERTLELDFPSDFWPFQLDNLITALRNMAPYASVNKDLIEIYLKKYVTTKHHAIHDFWNQHANEEQKAAGFAIAGYEGLMFRAAGGRTEFEPFVNDKHLLTQLNDARYKPAQTPAPAITPAAPSSTEVPSTNSPQAPTIPWEQMKKLILYKYYDPEPDIPQKYFEEFAQWFAKQNYSSQKGTFSTGPKREDVYYEYGGVPFRKNDVTVGNDDITRQLRYYPEAFLRYLVLTNQLVGFDIRRGSLNYLYFNPTFPDIEPRIITAAKIRQHLAEAEGKRV